MINRVSFFLGLILLIPLSVQARDATHEELKGILKIPERSQNALQQHGREQLANDAHFIKTLWGLLKSKNLSEEEKIYSFYLMQKRIGWAFAGIVHMPLGYNYYKVFNGHIAFYYKVHNELKSLNYNITPFLEIAEKYYQSNVLLSANALLLAAILDPKHTKEIVIKYLAYEKIQKAQVPDILNHYLCLSLVFMLDDQVLMSLGKNLLLIPSEESKEDIICLLGIYQNPKGWAYISDYILDENEVSRGQAIETGFYVLKKRLTSKDVNNTLEKVQNQKQNQWKADLLEGVSQRKEDSEFMKGAWIKVWDSFDISIYDNGIMVTFENNFKEFFDK